jgi:hypothetical protein
MSENSIGLFSKVSYIRTYMDDGLHITKEKESADEICDWLDMLYSIVD